MNPLKWFRLRFARVLGSALAAPWYAAVSLSLLSCGESSGVATAVGGGSPGPPLAEAKQDLPVDEALSPQTGTALGSLTFIAWVEPREHSFSGV